MEFTTDIELDISSTKLEEYLKTLGYDYTIDSINTTEQSINWSLELEVRYWGIKYASAFVPDQYINLNLEIYKPNSEEPESIDIMLELKDIETYGAMSMPITPTTLSFDGKKWCLNFE